MFFFFVRLGVNATGRFLGVFIADACVAGTRGGPAVTSVEW